MLLPPLDRAPAPGERVIAGHFHLEGRGGQAAEEPTNDHGQLRMVFDGGGHDAAASDIRPISPA